jgi:hypothetical protein
LLSLYLTRSHTELNLWKVIINTTRTIWNCNFRNVYCFTPDVVICKTTTNVNCKVIN